MLLFDLSLSYVSDSRLQAVLRVRKIAGRSLDGKLGVTQAAIPHLEL